MATQKTTLENHAKKPPHPLVISQTITAEETAKGRASQPPKQNAKRHHPHIYEYIYFDYQRGC